MTCMDGRNFCATFKIRDWLENQNIAVYFIFEQKVPKEKGAQNFGRLFDILSCPQLIWFKPYYSIQNPN